MSIASVEEMNNNGNQISDTYSTQISGTVLELAVTSEFPIKHLTRINSKGLFVRVTVSAPLTLNSNLATGNFILSEKEVCEVHT